MASWKHIDIIVDGQPVKAQAPIIVSVSRSSDLPAFYSDWFFGRLAKGILHGQIPIREFHDFCYGQCIRKIAAEGKEFIDKVNNYIATSISRY